MNPSPTIMSVFNTVTSQLKCPRCEGQAAMQIEVKAGFCDQIDYVLGDRYQWIPQVAEQNGGRPPDGSLEMEGYVECPLCGKDFFVNVFVIKDSLSDVKINLRKIGYIQ